MTEKIDRKVQFSQLRKLRDLDLDLGRGHTGAHIWSRSTQTLNYIEIGKTNFFGTYGPTDTPDFSKKIIQNVRLLCKLLAAYYLHTTKWQKQ